MYTGGLLEEAAMRLPGVEVYSLAKTGRYDFAGSISRFVRLVKSTKINLVWSYAGGSEYGLVTKLLRQSKLVIGVRHAGLDKVKYPYLRELLFKFEAQLSRMSDLVVANSWAGRNYLISFGYSPKKILVVPNGYDTSRFNSFPDLREQVRKDWQYGDDTVLIGIVGRVDPLKDHDTFLRAAAIVSAEGKQYRFVCVGEGPDHHCERLRHLADELGLADRVKWAGSRTDMPAVYNSLDILVLCSLSEGTPNVVGEAMASCTPCIVSRCGDAAILLGDESRTVPIRGVEELALAISRLGSCSAEEREEIGNRDRRRIENVYSVELLGQRTEAVVMGVLEGKKPGDILAIGNLSPDCGK